MKYWKYKSPIVDSYFKYFMMLDDNNFIWIQDTTITKGFLFGSRDTNGNIRAYGRVPSNFDIEIDEHEFRDVFDETIGKLREQVEGAAFVWRDI